MKKLKLHRETVATLTSSDLSAVHGGGGSIIVIQNTRVCPIPLPTHGCTGAGCVETIGTSGTSVINPSGGFGG
jgi:hypothetical protein